MRINWGSISSQLVGATNSRAVPSGKRAINSRTKANPATNASKRAATPQYKRDDKIQAVEQAKKKVERQPKVLAKDPPNSNARVHYPFVFVGNLMSSITEARLMGIFAPCGTVHRVEIRCSRGQAITSGIAIPSEVLTKRDRQYASIEFEEPEAARAALRLNGSNIDGCNIVVTATPADLPEVQDIVLSRLGNIRKRQGLPNPYQQKMRPIPIETTLPHLNRPATDRHRFLGISFAKCVI